MSAQLTMRVWVIELSQEEFVSQNKGVANVEQMRKCHNSHIGCRGFMKLTECSWGAYGWILRNFDVQAAEGCGYRSNCGQQRSSGIGSAQVTPCDFETWFCPKKPMWTSSLVGGRGYSGTAGRSRHLGCWVAGGWKEQLLWRELEPASGMGVEALGRCSELVGLNCLIREVITV